ncbi:receptor kinase-like protein Xa21 [Amborella trichopoda]|uniref:receptor kinase-like protein Xa21 n=1 Tax=Amborella trichopoda TaxID=13333 RepID=UPI0005D3C6F8|nr:receptor kinase-like protein Xa21 [Amborella trichopoda]|eukprot:XP_011623353.1 receptor kinase-like protein Xa21 [Amborella trichopoda]
MVVIREEKRVLRQEFAGLLTKMIHRQALEASLVEVISELTRTIESETLAMEEQTQVVVELKERVQDPEASFAACRAEIGNWNTSMNFCNWTGVSCSKRRQRVTYLNLASTGLQGMLTPHIGNRSFLQVLTLRNNSFHGSIPPEIGWKDASLRNWVFYKRSRTLPLEQPSGPIPSSLHNASKLTVLELQKNQFNGPVPTSLGHLRALKVLHLNNNRLENWPGSPNLSFIDSLTNCTFMEVLQLGNNPIAGFMPDSIGNLSNNLKSFTVGGCHIVGSIPESIGNLQSLTGTSWKDPSPQSLALENLNLSFNSFQGAISRTFGDMISLKYMDISSNKLSGEIPGSLCSLKFLWFLNLSFNDLEGPIPSKGVFANITADSQRHELRSVIADGVSQIKGIRWISYYELLRATNNFNNSNLLGIGSFGSVYKGIVSDGSLAAIKVMNLQREGSTKSFHTE